MIRLALQSSTLLRPAFRFAAQKYSYISEIDTANITALTEHTAAPMNSFFEKLEMIRPFTLYNYLDEFSRESLFYFANDLGLGLGAAIVIISLGIKALYTPIAIKAQLGAIKMKAMDNEMKIFQERTRDAQRTGNMALMKQAQKDFREIREKNGIRTWHSLVMISQIPLLMTWFFSLRYVTSLPELYPSIKYQGFLWFQNLAEADPYYILPVLSAFISYYNISNSRNMMSGASAMPLMATMMQYMKFMPICAIPFVAFFPSALNLYWTCLALSQSVIVMSMNTSIAEKYITKPKQAEKILKAFVVEEKQKPKIIVEKVAQGPEGTKHFEIKREDSKPTAATGDQTVGVTFKRGKKK